MTEPSKLVTAACAGARAALDVFDALLAEVPVDQDETWLSVNDVRALLKTARETIDDDHMQRLLSERLP